MKFSFSKDRGCARPVLTLGAFLLLPVIGVGPARAFDQAVQADTCIEFQYSENLGCVPTGEAAFSDIYVRNPAESACDTLTVFGVSFSSPFYSTPTSFPIKIPRGVTASIDFDFLSPGPGDHSDGMEIHSDDPTYPTVVSSISCVTKAIPVPGGLVDFGCVDTLGLFDPPYTAVVTLRNDGCIPLYIEDSFMRLGAFYLDTFFPDTILPGFTDSIGIEAWPFVNGDHRDTLEILTSDGAFNYSDIVPVRMRTFQPEKPGAPTTLDPVTPAIASCPSGDTRPEERTHRVTLRNKYGCPVRSFPVTSLGWGFPVLCTAGDTSHVQFEVLDTESDLDGVIDARVWHEPPANTPCSWSDCCAYDLTVSYGAFTWIDSNGVRTFDLDGDRDVDQADIDIITLWLFEGVEFCGDFDGDGLVTTFDVFRLVEHAAVVDACIVTDLTGTDQGGSQRILSLGIRPNPVAAGTEVRFHVSLPGADASLVIYDLKGRRVRSLMGSGIGAGPHVISWDGRDGQGREVGSGIYFSRLESGAQTEISRFLLLR